MKTLTLLRTMVGTSYWSDHRIEECAFMANVRDRGNAVTGGVRFVEGSGLTHALLEHHGDVDGLHLGIGQPPEEGLMVWTGRLVTQTAERAWDSAGGQQMAATQVAGRYEGRWRKPTAAELEAARWFEPDGKIQITWQKKTTITLERALPPR